MLLANAAPRATRTPMITRVAESAELAINAAFEAMKRFEGPANGIMLSPKDMRKTINSSMIGAI
jgi:hypothetical protein